MRLTNLYHWVDKNGDNKRDANELRAEFAYTLRQGVGTPLADGRRLAVEEKIWDETGFQVSSNRFDWSYDSVDRLISETAVMNGFSGYDLDWVYDLTGNRISQTKTSGGTTEVTSYQYDANDRLTQSTLTGSAQPETISYTYDKTRQTGKTTVLSPWSSRRQTFAYNLQGLLGEVTASTTSGGTTSVASKTIYGYDSDGTRIRSTLYERFIPEGYDPENPPPETLVLKSTTVQRSMGFRPELTYVKLRSESITSTEGRSISMTMLTGWARGSVGRDIAPAESSQLMPASGKRATISP